jgi:hypothetical protein
LSGNSADIAEEKKTANGARERVTFLPAIPSAYRAERNTGCHRLTFAENHSAIAGGVGSSLGVQRANKAKRINPAVAYSGEIKKILKFLFDLVGNWGLDTTSAIRPSNFPIWMMRCCSINWQNFNIKYVIAFLVLP